MSSVSIKVRKSDIWLHMYLIGVMLFYTFDGAVIEFAGLQYILLIALVAGATKIFSTLHVDIKTFFVLILIGCVIFFRMSYSYDTRMVVVFVSLLCALNEKKANIVNICFYSKMFAFLIVILFGGYKHINGVALHGGMLLLLYICKEEKNPYDYYKKLLLLIGCSVVLCHYTNSGSAIVCLCIAIVFMIFKKFEFGLRLLSSPPVVLIFPLALFLNYFFAAGVGESRMPFVGRLVPESINYIYVKLVEVLDNATSSRLSLVKYSFSRFGASWLGGNVDYTSELLQEVQYFNLDSGFMWLVQGWGYLMCIVLMILCVLLMKYFADNKEYDFVIAGITIALWAINEDMLVSVGTNFLLIFSGQAVLYWKKRRGGKLER